MATKSIESALAEITLRRYEKPYDASARDLVAKVCLSLGLLQPGDSRDVIVDVLYVLLQARTKKEAMTSIEVRNAVVDVRREFELKLIGIADSNIRRQLLRLRDLFVVEKVKNTYRIAENEQLLTLFDEKIIKFYLPSIVQRVREYMQATDEKFK